MINSNELRRGNLVETVPPKFGKPKPPGIAGPFKVEEIKKGWIYAEHLKSRLPFGMSDSQVQGIPLTPEILDAIFNPDFTTQFYRKLDFAIHKTTGLVDFKNIPIREIKTLHELQNLHFALTGEELDIKNILK